MTANTQPIFTLTPNDGVVAISAANTARDGSGTLYDVVTAGANGTRIDHIEVVAQGTTTVNVVRLFLYNGTTNFLRQEILVTAITPSTSVAVFSTQVTFTNGLVIPTGWKLRASTNNAETYNVFAYGGDY